MKTFTVATDRFLELGRLQARALGRGDLRIIVVPHPLAGLNPADALRLGRVAGSEMLTDFELESGADR